MENRKAVYEKFSRELSECNSLIECFYLKNKYWLFIYMKNKLHHNMAVCDYRQKLQQFRYYDFFGQKIDLLKILSVADDVFVRKSRDSEIIGVDLMIDFESGQRVVHRCSVDEAKRIKNEIVRLLGW